MNTTTPKIKRLKFDSKKKKYLIFGALVFVFISLFLFIGNNLLKSSAKISSNENAFFKEDTEIEIKAGTPDEPETFGIEEAILNSDQKIFGQNEKESLLLNKTPTNPDDTTKNFNILILGIDRRHGDQTSWRTDVIQLVTLNPQRNVAVVTHIPRDVWADKYKINSIYNLQGPEAMKDQVEIITGQRPDRIIRVDFDAFVWLVDSVGGLNINVPTAFTDSEYPNDRKGINEPITISFDSGQQEMDGETALMYVRSRKGTNGEGSDYARGRRQQEVMRAMVKDLFKPDNLFNPKTAETLYNLATQKVYTDMTLMDSKVLFEVLKNYANIQVRNIGLDTTNYLIVPSDKTPYGGAWVLVAKDGTYQPVHDDIYGKLN